MEKQNWYKCKLLYRWWKEPRTECQRPGVWTTYLRQWTHPTLNSWASIYVWNANGHNCHNTVLWLFWGSNGEILNWFVIREAGDTCQEPRIVLLLFYILNEWCYGGQQETVEALTGKHLKWFQLSWKSLLGSEQITWPTLESKTTSDKVKCQREFIAASWGQCHETERPCMKLAGNIEGQQALSGQAFPWLIQTVKLPQYTWLALISQCPNSSFIWSDTIWTEKQNSR